MYIKGWFKPILPLFLTDFFINENSQYTWLIFMPPPPTSVFLAMLQLWCIKNVPPVKSRISITQTCLDPKYLPFHV